MDRVADTSHAGDALFLNQDITEKSLFVDKHS